MFYINFSGITDHILQKYKIASVEPESCQNPENKENSSCHRHSKKERLSQNPPLLYDTGPLSTKVILDR